MKKTITDSIFKPWMDTETYNKYFWINFFSLFFKNKTKILKVFRTFSKNIEHDQPFSCAFNFFWWFFFFFLGCSVTQVSRSWVRSTDSSSWVTQFIMLRHIWHSFHSEIHIVVTKFYSHLHINTQICHKKKEKCTAQTRTCTSPSGGNYSQSQTRKRDLKVKYTVITWDISLLILSVFDRFYSQLGQKVEV